MMLLEKKFLCLFIGISMVSMTTGIGARPLTDTVYLAVGTSIDITANAYGSNVLRTFCYPGKSRSLLSLFETVELIISIANDDYSEYGGRTPEEVLQHYTEKTSLFSFTLLSQKRTRVQLSPFEQQCIGIASKQPYNVNLKHSHVDMWRVLQLTAGILIFYSAGQLAKNSAFYYLAGMVLGVCASLLVIIAMTSKLFPRRPLMYGVLIGGWTIGLYIIKQLVYNIRLILVTYRDYVLWYVAITGLVSFLICYRIGPPINPRSQNIIMWVLQAIGAVIVFTSSWHTSGCAVLLVATFVAHYFPDSLRDYLYSVYKRRFPSPRRLLTHEEYYQQTVNETAKSLSELRDYVNSPHCRQWSIMNALRDPMRFATFANGAPHLYDEEIEDYSRAIEESMEGADEEEAEDYLSCSMYYRPTARRSNQRHMAPNLPVNPNRYLPQDRHPNPIRIDLRNESEEEDDDNDLYLEQE